MTEALPARRIDHVSIAVRDLEKAKDLFVKGLGGKEIFCQPWPEMKFRWTTIELGTSCLLELIDPLGRDGFVHKFLETKGEGLHHITIQVDSIEKTRSLLSERGIPTFGYGEPLPGWKEIYIHPQHAFGALIQLAEFKPLDWVNPGYIPAAYQEFAPPAKAPAEGWIVRKVETEEGPQVEIRQGDKALRIPKKRLPELIQALEAC
jgi:methylmalonyl-CoA/ethylmalonyl-CoA epimerase